MAKLTGAAKKEFLERMAKGRRKAERGNPQRKKATKKKNAAKAAKRKPAKRKAPKKAKAKTKNPTVRKSKKVIAKGFGRHTAAEWAKEKKRGKKANPKTRSRGRRNSSIEEAVAMYETFHQRAPGHIVDYEELVNYPNAFTELGKLKELRVFLDSANPDFPFTRFGDCQVVCTPDGQNIYFNGGDQSIDYEALDISSEKDTIELGPCTYIMYHTTKGFHDFDPTDYWHRFGEEDGIFPRLGYDRLNKRLFLIGGNYQVRREGIVN